MIRLIDIKNKVNVRTEVLNSEVLEKADVIAELYVDDLSELDSYTEIEGLDLKRYTLTGGSYAYDKSLNVAVLDSSLQWNTLSDV